MESESKTDPPSSTDQKQSYAINPSEDLLLSFEGEPCLVRKRRQKTRKSSSGNSSKRRISDIQPQISEELLNIIPIWTFWYAVFEFLHMEFLAEYDVVLGVIVYIWLALYITTEQQYYE